MFDRYLRMLSGMYGNSFGYAAIPVSTSTEWALMTGENWWLAAKLVLGLPLLFYVLLSVLEPQEEVWRKPTKKILIGLIAWALFSVS